MINMQAIDADALHHSARGGNAFKHVVQGVNYIRKPLQH